MTKSRKVLLAEGHTPTREAIYNEIRAIPGVTLVASVNSALGLINYLDKGDSYPDIILMDVDIDVQHSFWCMRKLAVNYPSLSVIVLAASDETLVIRKMVDLGARGYILKENYTEGLRKWLGGQAVYRDSSINKEYSADSPLSGKDASGLDQKEIAVLRLIINQYSSREIAEKLSMNRTEVNEAMDQLHRKTNSSNSLDLKRYALRHSIF
jgi:DNA-binding NarL/FixJ family response regulator